MNEQNEQADTQSRRVQDDWDALLREKAELNSGIAADQSAMAKKQARLAKLRDYMSAFRSFHFGEEQDQPGSYLFEPGGPCPIPMEDLGVMEGYQAALRALGTVLPGGFVHGRTAGQWLMDAGILESMPINAARMRINKFMGRSPEWEPVEERRGWFRYLPESTPENDQDTLSRDSEVAKQV